MAKTQILTATEARQLFHYDPETGILIWRTRSRQECKSEMAWRAMSGLFGTAAGTIAVNGYRSISVNGKRYYAHRLAWLIVTGNWPTADVDHCNGDRSDNRWSNLRAATRSQNHQNRAAKPTTGASWHTKAGKWRAVIAVNGRQFHIGTFDTQDEAAEAYRKAKAARHTFQPQPRPAGKKNAGP
jgi:hypothetical protein